MTAVSITGLRKEFEVRHGRGKPETVVALDGIDLTVAAGEMVVLVGPSGCGKTTLLRCLAGLEQATEGKITIGGETVFDSARKYNLPSNQRDIGMVFQKYALWPHMSVLKNVEYPLRSKRLKNALRDGRAQRALESVRCDVYADRIPAALSGGQQQRVALARAIVSDPAVLLLDEPLSNLDALLRITLREELRAFHREIGFTGVYVTHDQSEALSLGDRVAVMQAGSIQQIATPQEVFDAPATPDVATFIGVRNRIVVQRVAEGWRTPCGPLTGIDPGPGEEYELFARPEAVQLSAPGTPVDGPMLGVGTVTETLFCGESIEFIVDIEGTRIIAVAPRPDAPYVLGDTVQVGIAPGKALLYRDGALAAPPIVAAAG